MASKQNKQIPAGNKKQITGGEYIEMNLSEDEMQDPYEKFTTKQNISDKGKNGVKFTINSKK